MRIFLQGKMAVLATETGGLITGAYQKGLLTPSAVYDTLNNFVGVKLFYKEVNQILNIQVYNAADPNNRVSDLAGVPYPDAQTAFNAICDVVGFNGGGGGGAVTSVNGQTGAVTVNFNGVLAAGNNSVIRALFNGIPYVAANEIPNFIDETATIADLQANQTYFYIGSTNKTFDYDLEPQPPNPAPPDNITIVNLSPYVVTINSDGGNFTYNLTYFQSLANTVVLDNGLWQVDGTYLDNIYNLQQVTDKGSETTDAIIIKNNPDIYRTRYSILGQEVQRDDLGYRVSSSHFAIRKTTISNSKSWELQYPDLSANANNSAFVVNVRPNVSGTLAYLEDFGNAIFLTETSTVADIQPNKLHIYVGMSGHSLDYTPIGGLPQPPNPAPTGQNFDIINLSNYTISLDFDNGGFNVTRLQGYQNVEIVDNGNGYWEMQATAFWGNTLQEITSNGNSTSNNIQLNGSQITFSNFFANAILRCNPGNENLDIGSNANAFFASLSKQALTQNRTFSFPDTSGTLLVSSIITISTNTNLTNENTVLVDTTSGVITVNLPSAASYNSKIYNIKKITAANTVIIDGNAGETIDGNLTIVLANQWEAVTLQSNGTEWFILASF